MAGKRENPEDIVLKLRASTGWATRLRKRTSERSKNSPGLQKISGHGNTG
jgi:hypothetical protein